MKTKIIKMKMINQFEQEYENAIQSINHKYNQLTEVIFNAKQRLLEIANFYKSLGLDYNFIAEYYDTYKEMLEKLLTN